MCVSLLECHITLLTWRGKVGCDTLNGGEGDDTIRANDGSTEDTVDCGGGSNDTAYVDTIRNPLDPNTRIPYESGGINNRENINPPS